MKVMTESDQQDTPSQYCSYLLRLWTENARGQSPWRIVLIDLRTGQRQGFTNFERLMDFIQEELSDASGFTAKEAGTT
jgi:hypothetical protein